MEAYQLDTKLSLVHNFCHCGVLCMCVDACVCACVYVCVCEHVYRSIRVGVRTASSELYR